MRKLLASLLLLIVFSVFIFFGGAVLKIFGSLDGPGVIEGKVLPSNVVEERANRVNLVKSELEVLDDKQILFGDLHVHTTYSTDAFMWSLPFMNGKGASPIADACDYARFCSALDSGLSMTMQRQAHQESGWKQKKVFSNAIIYLRVQMTW